MPRLNLVAFRRALLNIVAVVTIVAITILAMRLFGPQPTQGQPANLGDVQVTSLTLVGADGNVLARLQRGANSNGQLALFDGTTGNLRLRIAGLGSMSVFDSDGTTLRFTAGYVTQAISAGNPPVNGIQLDPQGEVTFLPPSP